PGVQTCRSTIIGFPLFLIDAEAHVGCLHIAAPAGAASSRGSRVRWLAGGYIACGWQLGTVPASAQSFDQLNGGDHLLQANGFGALLVAEQRGLRGDDVE